MAATTRETLISSIEVDERQLTGPAAPEIVPKLIACTFFTGVVAYDARLDSRQGQRFANWAQSELSWERTFIERWPDDEAPAARLAAVGRPAVSTVVASPETGQQTAQAAQEAPVVPMLVRGPQS